MIDLAERGVELVDLEATGEMGEWLAPREKRDAVLVGMFAGILAISTTDSRPRRRRLWLKVIDATAVDYAVQYTGELVSDTYLDLELGETFRFLPEHILEWSTRLP